MIDLRRIAKSSDPQAPTAKRGVQLIARVFKELDRRSAEDLLLPMNATGMATRAGVAKSTISGWRKCQAWPAIDAFAKAGSYVSLRLVWKPTSRSYPGMKRERLPGGPALHTWWPDMEFSDDEVVRTIQQLGRELAYARSNIRKVSIGEAVNWEQHPSGLNREVWGAVEGWAFGKNARSIPSLRAYLLAGSAVGLDLAWERTGTPWRVPPWETIGPPARIPQVR